MKPLRSPRTSIRAALGAALLATPLTLAGSTGSAQAAVGTPAPAGALAHTAQLSVGEWPENRGCTATLVDELWLATAASCFAETPGQAVPAGKPARKTTATFNGGTMIDVVELAPRTDRDLVLARLGRPVQSIAPVKLATAAPAAGIAVSAAGFGRTRTEWVPDRLHSGAFTVANSTAGELTLDSANRTDVLCKGDTGGPVLNAAGELVGVNSRSWQGGCLGAPAAETRTGAIAARTDGLASWIASVKQRPVVFKAGETLQPGEMLASQNARLIMQADGNLVLYHRTGGENKGGALWASGTSGNPGAFAKVQTDGNFVVYKQGGGADASTALWQSKTYGYDGARLELQADANLVVYTKDGGPGIGGHLWHTDTYPRGSKLASGAKLMPGSWLTNGQNVLMMDIQGNVLIREQATSRELWGKYTWNWHSYLNMQADGALVLTKKDGGALWSATSGGAGSYATLENNGSLVVRWNSGGERWASSSFRGDGSGRCLDSNGGTGATIWDCWGGPSQQWDYTPAKELRVNGNRCLTAETGANQGAKVTTAACDGRNEQKWNVNADTITAFLNPRQCMNVSGQATANGSALGLWECNGGSNTKWKRP
jgi:hypothetical protein